MAGDNRGKTVVELSSLPLQILLFLNIYYAIVFCVAELLLYIYKGTILPYPDMARTLTIEIVIIFLLAFIEGVRIFLGYKGNLAERTISLVFSVVLGIPVLFIELFILLWQTYVLRLEAILVGIGLVFLGLEIIFSIAAIFTFKSFARDVCIIEDSDNLERKYLFVKIIHIEVNKTDSIASEMSSFLPSIDSVRKSSLVAAKRIYSAMDYLEAASSNRNLEKKRNGHKKSRKLKTPPSDPNPQQKAERSKEYSQKLKSRRERAKLAREESLAERKNYQEIKEKGLREKRRLNELFSVYAAQQGLSFRSSAKVVKPKFPALLKSAKSSAISREKLPFPNSPLPNLASFNRMDKDSHE